MPAIRYPFRLFFRPFQVRFPIIVALILNSIAWIWLLWYVKPGQDTVFLHYTILYGVDAIGEWWRLFFLPLTGFTILTANTVLGWISFQRSELITYVLNAASVLSQIFILIAVIRLVALNV